MTRFWDDLRREGCRDVVALREPLGIGEAELEAMRSVQAEYPMLASRYYLSLIDPSDPDDPVRRMCVPSAGELMADGEMDTSGERGNTVVCGVQHKYAETALVLVSSECATYCRHCFRRRFVGTSNDEVATDIDAAVGYIRDHPEISNVLLSGGDALVIPNETIGEWLDALAPIGHVRLVRLGTKIPVVLPQRISEDEELLSMLGRFSARKQAYVVTQFNHPHEVTSEAAAAVASLLRVGVPVRNQTVLMRGVNDSAPVLARLMDDLTSIGAMPYYVFQCRPVRGVKSTFQLPIREGIRIVEDARRVLNGLAKGFRFVMSHPTGKIEFLGEAGPEFVLLKYQAKDRADLGKVFLSRVDDSSCWLSPSPPMVGLSG